MGNVQEVFETRDFPPLDVQLLRAAEYGDVDHLQQLLDRHKNGEDFNIDVTSNYLWTPLFMAAKQGHADCVQLLLEAGAVVDGISQNKSSWTPLWVATYAGHEQCVKILLENGASLEAKSPETPLFVAAREGKIRCLQYLIEHGANVNVIDKSGQTPLHAAAFENRAPVAKELVNAGCLVDAEDSKGFTPLSMACFHAEKEVIELLLAAGADFKKMFKSAIYNYFTPVHICASKSKTDCIEVLWKFGACLNIRNGDGLLPKELTPDEKCRELLIRLEGTVRSLKDLCRLKLNHFFSRSHLNIYLQEAGIPKELLYYMRYEKLS